MRSRRLRRTTTRAMSAVATLAAAALLSGCGSNARTALAIDAVRWHSATSLLLTTECSTDVEAEVGPDHSGNGLTEVTLWGEPSMGTCRPEVEVTIDADTTRIVDGTTSMVVDLPPYPG